ncbi:VOC family protein [Nocardioides sp. YIM 152315]|uniref:VOC family protein n=1 Tax=Nocardioides sp. YIM 152315 TaxID=3031760 RepID=UPI0023D9B8A8|nr:VOC family protein [Nocardioides sp. YIM 152315]MDF1602493.1 VOC family protein [Nocardioides sp. YIM 152315]
MDINLHTTFLPQDDPEAALRFYRDTLGFELRNDVGFDGKRWLTMGSSQQPSVNIVLYPPGADPGITEAERQVITEMMAKGTFGSMLFSSKDLDATFEELQAADVDIVQEPTDQPWGVRDCAVRDPAGNMLRIQAAS